MFSTFHPTELQLLFHVNSVLQGSLPLCMTTGLLDLPPELRRLTYRYLFRGQRLLYRPYSSDDKDNPEPLPIPLNHSIILVCKQLYHEVTIPIIQEAADSICIDQLIRAKVNFNNTKLGTCKDLITKIILNEPPSIDVSPSLVDLVSGLPNLETLVIYVRSRLFTYPVLKAHISNPFWVAQYRRQTYRDVLEELEGAVGPVHRLKIETIWRDRHLDSGLLVKVPTMKEKIPGALPVDAYVSCYVACRVRLSI